MTDLTQDWSEPDLAPPPRWRAGFARLAAIWAAEGARRILWIPVAIGTGVVLYFERETEPDAALPAAICALALAIAIWCRRLPVAALPAALALVALGFTAAQLRTMQVAAPVLAAPIGPVTVEGVVTALDPRENGLRVLLGTPRIDGIGAESTPRRLRVRLSEGSDAPRLGERIRLTAVLRPPTRPVAPGAYDQRRQLWFEGVGGTGWTARRFDRSRDIVGGETPSVMAQLRRTVAARIGAVLKGGAGAIAIALLTGERGLMDEADIVAMRDSGLAHLLAISGMNIGIAAGLVFVALRAVLAASPRLALTLPIKKIAAAAALVAVVAYTELVGAPVSAERSMLMSGAVLAAILVDRASVALRTMALAAIVLLLAEPEELVGASFQMSFGAVLAIVAAWEQLRTRIFAWLEGGGAVRRGVAYLTGIAGMSALATCATAPFSLYHFQQISTWGVIANLLAVPLNDFWIMGWGVLAYLLMPFGLEQVALIPMGWGVQLLLGIARFFANLPGAVLRVPAMPASAFACAVAGGLWLLLWRHRIRHLGWIGIAAAAIAAYVTTAPDLLVAEDGRLIGVRRVDGALALSTTRRAQFTAEIWSRRLGGAALVPFPAPGITTPPLVCRGGACRVGDVLLVDDKRPAAALCVDIRMVIDPADAGACPGVQRIDRAALSREGAHAITLAPHRITTVAAVSGARPWTLSGAR
jgi:competence protein ComEC